MLLLETGVGGVIDPVKSNLSLARFSCLAAATTSESRVQGINKSGLLMSVRSNPKPPVFAHLTQFCREIHALGQLKGERMEEKHYSDDFMF